MKISFRKLYLVFIASLGELKKSYSVLDLGEIWMKDALEIAPNIRCSGSGYATQERAPKAELDWVKHPILGSSATLLSFNVRLPVPACLTVLIRLIGGRDAET